MENDQDDHINVSLSLIADYGASDSDSDDTETRSNDNTGNEDSDAAELSEMVLKNNIINACAHGPLSRSNAGDRAEVSRHMIIDSSETGVMEYEVTEYRDIDSDSDTGSSSDSSDSDVESVKDVEELSSGDETGRAGKSKKIEPPKVQGELELDDLPPIEDLAISLPSQETVKIGTIASIVDRLVIVRALPDTPAVDLDSVLFLENGSKALGKVFDVFGPVSEPHYCVRFNSAEHVRARGAAPGLPVYIAPRTPHTTYVFLSQLMNVKGTDASWLNDLEPPPHQVEYSDDEEERRATRARKEQAKLSRQEEAAPDGEASRSQPPARRPQEPRRAQRPSDSSSRFGGAPSRGRNPFAAGSRRSAPAAPRHPRPWAGDAGARTPPPHPADPGGRGPFGAPPFPPRGPPMFPLGFDPNTPPPFMGNPFRFGGSPMMAGVPMGGPRFPPAHPVFGSSYRGGGGALPRWVNNIPPPPPGT